MAERELLMTNHCESAESAYVNTDQSASLPPHRTELWDFFGYKFPSFFLSSVFSLSTGEVIGLLGNYVGES